MNILYERKLFSTKLCGPDFMKYDRQKPLSDNDWITYSQPLQHTYN